MSFGDYPDDTDQPVTWGIGILSRFGQNYIHILMNGVLSALSNVTKDAGADA